MTSPWLATPSVPSANGSTSSSSSSSSSDTLDPWRDSARRGSSSSTVRSRLGSWSASSTYLSAEASSSRQVDRHPLRSPSPNLAQSVSASASGLARRRNASGSSPGEASSSSSAHNTARSTPGGIVSEWKAISAGLAGLFSSGSDDSRYQWPEDPVTGFETRRPGGGQQGNGQGQAGDEGEKGHPPSALDKLEGWFGLKDDSISRGRLASASSPSLRSASNASTTAQEAQVRVLIHPVAPSDTLSSLALHYGADIQTLRRSNKLWPGDAVQMRSTMYIPIDSCRYRPPNAEIKVLPTNGGAIVTSEHQQHHQQDGQASTVAAASARTGAAGLKLAFVPKDQDDDDDFAAGAATVADTSATSLVAPAEDPAFDFLQDTNKSYADVSSSSGAAFGGGGGSPAAKAATVSRASSISRLGGGYPPILAPSARPDRRLAAASIFENSTPHAGPSSAVAAGPGGLHRSHSRTGSVGGSTSASAASSGFVAPRGPIHVSKIPADKLRFFTPSDRKTTMAEGSSGGDSGKPRLGVGPGHPDYKPGESGLDDLLNGKSRTQDAGQSSLSSSSSPSPSTTAEGGGSSMLRPSGSTLLAPATVRPSLLSHVSDLSSTTTGGASDNFDADGDAEWKPNVWKFGQSRSRSAQRASGDGGPARCPDADGIVIFDAGLESTSSVATAGRSLSPETMRSYAGWNDAPPAHAIVAKAYDNGAAHRKRQNQKHHRLLYDLAAGLPANTGAASKWARPINFGDSLPPSSSSTALATTSIGRNAGLGKLLNDTIRGRISVEGALEKALEEVRTPSTIKGRTMGDPLTNNPTEITAANAIRPSSSREDLGRSDTTSRHELERWSDKNLASPSASSRAAMAQRQRSTTNSRGKDE